MNDTTNHGTTLDAAQLDTTRRALADAAALQSMTTVRWLVPGSGKARAPATSIQRGGSAAPGWRDFLTRHGGSGCPCHMRPSLSAPTTARWCPRPLSHDGQSARTSVRSLTTSGGGVPPSGRPATSNQPNEEDRCSTNRRRMTWASPISRSRSRPKRRGTSAEILAEVDGLEAGL